MPGFQASTTAMYLKFKQLVPFLLGLEVLYGFQQNVNSFCVADPLEARLCHMSQPVLYFWVTVTVHFCGGKELQVCSASSKHSTFMSSQLVNWNDSLNAAMVIQTMPKTHLFATDYYCIAMSIAGKKFLAIEYALGIDWITMDAFGLSRQGHQ